MTTKQGYLTPAPIGGIDNPNLASGFYGFAGNWYPYGQTKVGDPLVGVAERRYPASPHREITATITPSYSDIFYHRIHLVPQQIDLGNVVSTQEFNLYVWNAHFKQKRLAAISGVSEGITLEGKQAPYTFNPLEEQTYKVSVSPNGAKHY